MKLYVHTAGKGNPCLFIHGGPGLTSYIFEVTKAAKLIEEKAHMIYFDQRGSCSSSSAKNGDYSIIRMERDIEELRSFLRVSKWSVMGHSFGGIIMTAYARDYAVGPDSYKSWKFKNSKIVIYNGGHTSYQEEPVWFADTVLNFLKNQ